MRRGLFTLRYPATHNGALCLAPGPASAAAPRSRASLPGRALAVARLARTYTRRACDERRSRGRARRGPPRAYFAPPTRPLASARARARVKALIARFARTGENRV